MQASCSRTETGATDQKKKISYCPSRFKGIQVALVRRWLGQRQQGQVHLGQMPLTMTERKKEAL